MKYEKTLTTPEEIAHFWIDCAKRHGMTVNLIPSKNSLKKPFLCIPENGSYLETLN